MCTYYSYDHNMLTQTSNNLSVLLMTFGINSCHLLIEQMELENQVDLDIYDIQEEGLNREQSNQSQEYAEQKQQGESEVHQNIQSHMDNPAWKQLLEWGKANPGIMMNYANYPLEEQHVDKDQSNVNSKQILDGSDNSKLQGPERREKEENSFEQNDEDNQQQMRFEIGQFQDQDLGFDTDDKEFVFQENNQFNFQSLDENDFDFRDQKQQGTTPNQEPFFKEPSSNTNNLNNAENGFGNQLPSKQKRTYKKRKTHQGTEERLQEFFHLPKMSSGFQDVMIHDFIQSGPLPKHKIGAMKQKKKMFQEPFFMLEGNPSVKGGDGWMKKKKLTSSQIKRDLYNCMSKEDELQRLQHLKRNEQIAYVENRIRHYNQLKNIILKSRPKEETTKKVFRGVLEKQNNKINVPTQTEVNQTRTQQEQNSAVVKKTMAITPDLLRMLSAKFQLFTSYEQGKYDPGYKMSVGSMANQFQLTTTTVAALYNQWQGDPGFVKKIYSMENNVPFASQKTEQLQKSNQMPNRVPALKQLPIPSNDALNEQKMLEMRQVFAQKFRKLKSKGSRLYFLDECPKEMIMGTNRVEEQSQGKELNFSLMAVLGVKGRASWKVVHWFGSKYQRVQDIQQLYRNVREDQQVGFNEVVGNNKSYLILDSVVVKSPEKIKRIEQLTNTKVLLLPHFSKQLNPLQFWFSDVKGRLRMVPKSLAQLNKVLQTFQNCSNTDFGRYLSDADRYMSFAMQKLAF